MIRYFHSAERHEKDVYVADYNEATHHTRGVEIMHKKPTDIPSFHLSNPHNCPYWAVNFEKHPSFFKGASNCECIFTAIRNDNNKKWALLVELKYCNEKNIAPNAEKAWAQLLSTHNIIKDNGCIDETHKVFFNISMPLLSTRMPFTSFIDSQADIKKMKDEHNIILLGYNHLVIATPALIQLPREEI